MAAAAQRLEAIDTAFVSAVTGGDRVSAVRHLERSLVARKDAYGLADQRTAACAARLGILYNQVALSLKGSDPTAALELLGRCESLTEADGPIADQLVRTRLRAATLSNEGCVYRAAGKPHSALQCLERSLRMSSQTPQVVTSTRKENDAAGGLPRANVPAGAPDSKWHPTFDDPLLSIRPLLEESDMPPYAALPSPTLSDADVYAILTDQASTHLNMCAVLGQLGRHREAYSHCVEALQLLSDAGGPRPPHDFTETRNGFARDVPPRESLQTIALFNLAVTCEALRLPSRALEAYSSAHTSAVAVLGPDSALAREVGREAERAKRDLAGVVASTVPPPSVTPTNRLLTNVPSRRGAREGYGFPPSALVSQPSPFKGLADPGGAWGDPKDDTAVRRPGMQGMRKGQQAHRRPASGARKVPVPRPVSRNVRPATARAYREEDDDRDEAPSVARSSMGGGGGGGGDAAMSLPRLAPSYGSGALGGEEKPVSKASADKMATVLRHYDGLFADVLGGGGIASRGAKRPATATFSQPSPGSDFNAETGNPRTQQPRIRDLRQLASSVFPDSSTRPDLTTIARDPADYGRNVASSSHGGRPVTAGARMGSGGRAGQYARSVGAVAPARPDDVTTPVGAPETRALVEWVDSDDESVGSDDFDSEIGGSGTGAGERGGRANHSRKVGPIPPPVKEGGRVRPRYRGPKPDDRPMSGFHVKEDPSPFHSPDLGTYMAVLRPDRNMEMQLLATTTIPPEYLGAVLVLQQVFRSHRARKWWWRQQRVSQSARRERQAGTVAWSDEGSEQGSDLDVDDAVLSGNNDPPPASLSGSVLARRNPNARGVKSTSRRGLSRLARHAVLEIWKTGSKNSAVDIARRIHEERRAGFLSLRNTTASGIEREIRTKDSSRKVWRRTDGADMPKLVSGPRAPPLTGDAGHETLKRPLRPYIILFGDTKVVAEDTAGAKGSSPSIHDSDRQATTMSSASPVWVTLVLDHQPEIRMALRRLRGLDGADHHTGLSSNINPALCLGHAGDAPISRQNDEVMELDRRVRAAEEARSVNLRRLSGGRKRIHGRNGRSDGGNADEEDAVVSEAEDAARAIVVAARREARMAGMDADTEDEVDRGLPEITERPPEDPKHVVRHGALGIRPTQPHDPLDANYWAHAAVYDKRKPGEGSGSEDEGNMSPTGKRTAKGQSAGPNDGKSVSARAINEADWRRYTMRIREVRLVQRVMRGGVARMRFRRQKPMLERKRARREKENAAATTIQLACLRYLLRLRLLERRHKAAVDVQRVWRGGRDRERVSRLVYERECLLESQRRHAQLRHESARTIQRHFRGHSVRSRMPDLRVSKLAEQLKRRCSAGIIARAWRRFSRRRTEAAQREAAERRANAAVVVQSAWKGYVVRSEVVLPRRVLRMDPRPGAPLAYDASEREAARRIVRSDEENAAVDVQRVWRGARGRAVAKENRAARDIQKVVRGRKERKEVAKIVEARNEAATRIQSLARVPAAKKELEALKREKEYRDMRARRQAGAATKIQSVYRGRLGRRAAVEYRHQLEREADAAIDIQRMARGRLARVERRRLADQRLAAMTVAARLIQRMVKGHRARRRADLRRQLRKRIMQEPEREVGRLYIPVLRLGKTPASADTEDEDPYSDGKNGYDSRYPAAPGALGRRGASVRHRDTGGDSAARTGYLDPNSNNANSNANSEDGDQDGSDAEDVSPETLFEDFMRETVRAGHNIVLAVAEAERVARKVDDQFAFMDNGADGLSPRGRAGTESQRLGTSISSSRGLSRSAIGSNANAKANGADGTNANSDDAERPEDAIADAEEPTLSERLRRELFLSIEKADATLYRIRSAIGTIKKGTLTESGMSAQDFIGAPMEDTAPMARAKSKGKLPVPEEPVRSEDTGVESSASVMDKLMNKSRTPRALAIMKTIGEMQQKRGDRRLLTSERDPTGVGKLPLSEEFRLIIDEQERVERDLARDRESEELSRLEWQERQLMEWRIMKAGLVPDQLQDVAPVAAAPAATRKPPIAAARADTGDDGGTLQPVTSRAIVPPSPRQQAIEIALLRQKYEAGNSKRNGAVVDGDAEEERKRLERVEALRREHEQIDAERAARMKAAAAVQDRTPSDRDAGSHMGEGNDGGDGGDDGGSSSSAAPRRQGSSAAPPTRVRSSLEASGAIEPLETTTNSNANVSGSSATSSASSVNGGGSDTRSGNGRIPSESESADPIEALRALTMSGAERAALEKRESELEERRRFNRADSFRRITIAQQKGSKSVASSASTASHSATSVSLSTMSSDSSSGSEASPAPSRPAPSREAEDSVDLSMTISEDDEDQ